MKTKKIIVASLILLSFAGYVSAKVTEIPQRDFGFFFVGGNGLDVIKFVDPDNGNVCYLAVGRYKGGISCVKP